MNRSDSIKDPTIKPSLPGKNNDRQDPEGWLSATDLLNIEVDNDIWLMEDVLPRRGLCGLTGPSDCGKSTFLRQMCIHVANNDSEFIGHKLFCT